MNTQTRILSTYIITAICGLFWITGSTDAAVVSRTQRKTSAASRTPTMALQTTAPQTTEPETTETIETVQSNTDTVISVPPQVDTSDTDTQIIIEDKSSTFDEILGTTTNTSAGSDTLAQQIRAQRAALDAADAVNAQNQAAKSGGKNACDANLRACMAEKCGTDFTKCAGDTETMFGTKLDECRRDLSCTGQEYKLFTEQIRADRDMNAKISGYNKIIDCGNQYNNCIITECGTFFDKCLGKSAGDQAIKKCDKIAKSCTEMDSGLASRVMDVFGTLRIDAEKQVARDEQRLYELRDLMRETCERIGAMFDERTLDCVYTVNFYAGDDKTLYASKKAYAGSTFNCEPNWFGIDITTFRENALRLTREQKSASAAMLGSGVGMGVGALTSGAIDRAIDRHRADTALKDAQDEHSELYPGSNPNAAVNKSSDTKSSDAKSSDAKSSDAKSSDAKSSDAKSSDAKSSDTKSSDAKSSKTKTPKLNKKQKQEQAEENRQEFLKKTGDKIKAQNAPNTTVRPPEITKLREIPKRETTGD